MYDLRDFTTADNSDTEYLVLGHAVYAEEIYVRCVLTFPLSNCVYFAHIYTLPTSASASSGPANHRTSSEHPPSFIVVSRRRLPVSVSNLGASRKPIQDHSVHRNVSISTLCKMSLPRP